MPKLTETDVAREADDDGVCGPVEILRFGDSGGLTQFGANLEILPPGSRSAQKHWHAAEDEFLYVLEGTLILHEGDAEIAIAAGEAAAFPAGRAVGHCLENLGAAPARYLIVGTRAAQDVVTYADLDRVLTVDRAARTHVWTDAAGRPAASAYAMD
ncbi:cupin domain-containing protein [Rhodobacteraceae bacterium CCMM004]|nr:cupin domain-containing protein [Rhodobacteraceae bacterium CCMM004]